jgi:uncharacterized protein YkwD
MRIALASGAAITALALLSPVAAQAHACAYSDATPGSATDQQLSRATVCLLNTQRTAHHLRRFKASRPLGLVAQRYAGEIVAAKDFSHVGPRGDTLMTRVEQMIPSQVAEFSAFGENLGWGDDTMGTPRQLVRGWMRSPVHRANILARAFNRVGVGVAGGAPVSGASNALTYVTVFGKTAKRVHSARCTLRHIDGQPVRVCRAKR